jgi:hypothetical protein
MTPPLVWLVLTSAFGRAPARLLTILVKSPAGALVQRFRGVLARQFKLGEDHPRKTVHQRTSGRFTANYQELGWCMSKCTSEH